jgi:hypothetical protein
MRAPLVVLALGFLRASAAEQRTGPFDLNVGAFRRARVVA